MSPTTPPPVATWVGQLDRHEPADDLVVDSRFTAARLLVTARGTPVGIVDLPLREGRAAAAEVDRALAEGLGDVPDPADPPWSDEPLTVVIATRGRPDSVRRCLRALVGGDHRAITVLVVDNDPDDDATAAVVASIADPRVQYVRETRRGASVGRNRGLQEARTALVAFTDDDTEPDRRWAGRVAGAFAADNDVVCTSGPVLAARLETPEERAADNAVAWSKGFSARRFSLDDPPADSAIFPFSPGLFGIGANLAVRAEVARGVGGFDEALGPGSATHGGEDCEFLVRLVLAGHVIAYAPGAWVWHHHRPTPDALRAQLRGYAVGLGGFLTKVALDPGARSAALRRLPAAVAALRRIAEREADAGAGLPPGAAGQRIRGLASGPYAYLRARRATRRAGGRVPPLTVSAPPLRPTDSGGATGRSAKIGTTPLPSRPAV